MDKPRTNFPKPYFGLGVCGKKLNEIKGSVGCWWWTQSHANQSLRLFPVLPSLQVNLKIIRPCFSEFFQATH